MNSRFYTAVSVAALTLSGAITSQAQVLDEIVVTSQKREQGLKDVPISISAVGGEAIENGSIDSLTELSASIPNLFINENQIDTTISIRGVSTGSNKGFEQSVGMYFDGISYGRSQLIRTPLVDLERVEVLRGPQPTLFGKNAIAGAVNVISAKPTDEFEGKLSASYEFNHKEPQVLGVLSGPLGGNFTGRVVGSFRDLDGYILNTTLNQKEPSKNELYLRGQVAWHNNDNLDLNLKGEYTTFDTKGYAMENNTPIGSYSAVFTGPLAVETDEDYRRESSPVSSDNELYNVVLTGNYKLGTHTITSITGYVEYNTFELIDVDYTALDLLDGTKQTEDYQQFSQEFRIASPGGEKLDYIAGVYYQSSDLKVTDEVHLGSLFAALPAPQNLFADSYSDRLYTQGSSLYSAFAQADFNVSDRVTITAGARLSHETKDGFRDLTILPGPTNVAGGLPSPSPAFPNLLEALWGGGLNIADHTVSGTIKEDNFDPLIRLQYKASDNVSLHASFTGGSKSGGFDVRSNSVKGSPVATPGTFEFDGESAKNYEIGAKMSWDRVQLNATAYLTNYSDLQTNVFDGVLSFLVENASEAKAQGIEADARFLVSENLELFGSAAYLDYKFTDFKKGQCNFAERFAGVTTQFCDRSDTTAPFAPEWTGNFGFSYEDNISENLVLDFNMNAKFSSSYFLSSNQDPNQVEDGYVKLGGQIGLSTADGGWRISAIVDNLTDERIGLVGGQLPLATLITRGTGAAYDSIYARPRNITLKLDYNF